MRRYFFNLAKLIKKSMHKPYYGFVPGHSYLGDDDMLNIASLVGKNADGIISKFEHRFSDLVGNGQAISYATGRMGFFHLMQTLGIGNGDEVILQGATCSVMVNAVMRTGATPVFADIDANTYGSSTESTKICITPATRMIVAQHSFGIPCDIESIAKLSKESGVFLLEDCALSLGSTVKGIAIGNFGDAALFSTDHGKPLNTLTGGLIYSLNEKLIDQLRSLQTDCGVLSVERQNALWKRLKLEANNCVPSRYGKMQLIDLLYSIGKRTNIVKRDFLDDDFGVSAESKYPYPARLPAFLAMVGLHELDRWPEVSRNRVDFMNRILEMLSNKKSADYLPGCYKNKSINIIPLRIAWHQPDGDKIRDQMSVFLNTDWTFFMKPIIATKDPLNEFKYHKGSCPVSEEIGPQMVNIPCAIPHDSEEALLNKIKSILQ